jgi:hypothetical protein
MLDGLDDIPWERLRGVFCSAEDVPNLLRRLSRSGKEGDDAIWELFEAICNQGSVSEASAFAVPFLVELATEPGLARRDLILGLIGDLADTTYLSANAEPGPRSGEVFRKDFEQRLAKEHEDVRRSRAAVFEHRDVICGLLKDSVPMVRAGSAYVLSRFPEHVTAFGPLLRQAAKREDDPHALAGVLWCLGAAGDDSPEAYSLLEAAVGASSDVRQSFAAAIALYRITGKLEGPALPIYRQMAAATWFKDSYLVGVPWDVSIDLDMQEVLAEVKPDPLGATQTLLRLLRQGVAQYNASQLAGVAHDLLELNFPEGNWRVCGPLTDAQVEVLRCVVETDAAWQATNHLFFLVPREAVKIKVARTDIERARDEMRSVLSRFGPEA